MPAFRCVVSVLVRELGDFLYEPTLRTQGRPWRQASSVDSITSVALITTVTADPSDSPSRSTDPRVMAETISLPPTLTTTSAMIVPSLTDLTVPWS